MRTYLSYALTALWHDRQRYLPGVLAVAFSAVLIALQWGMLLGMFTFASVTVDRTRADIWLAGPNLQSADLGRPIFDRYLARLAVQPEVDQAEVCVQQRAIWTRSDGSMEICQVVGSRLEGDALGAVAELTPDLRRRLAEDGSVVVDESDRDQLGVKDVGDVGEITGHRVRIVGFIKGFRGPAGAHVFCSIETARRVLRLGANQASYIVARCRRPDETAAVVERLRAAYPGLSVFAAADLSRRSRLYWLTKTKGGLALGYTAALGLLVGAVVTAQTLYAATAAQLHEYAILWALGVPVRRMAVLVLTQAFWVGVAGVALALPAILILANAANALSVVVLLPAWLLAATVAVTMVMALVSGVAGLRSLRRIEPAILLR